MPVTNPFLVSSDHTCFAQSINWLLDLNLEDDYIKFVQVLHNQRTGNGVGCFLDESVQEHIGVRESYAETFTQFEDWKRALEGKVNAGENLFVLGVQGTRQGHCVGVKVVEGVGSKDYFVFNYGFSPLVGKLEDPTKPAPAFKKLFNKLNLKNNYGPSESLKYVCITYSSVLAMNVSS